MNCNIEPLNNRVLVLCKEDEIIPGIIIPDTSKEKPHMGEVIALPIPTPDKDGKIHKHVIGIGDVIAFTKWDAQDFKNNKDYVTYNGKKLDYKKIFLIKIENILYREVKNA